MSSFFETIGWYPTIGDPTFMGWFTVVAYFITACFSFRVFSIGKFGRVPEKQKRLWLLITLLLFLLCINKQLDLQTFFTTTAKYYFLKYDIYSDRRLFQELFILTIFMIGIFTCVGLFLEYQKVIKNHYLAIFGLVFLVVFILIRASSFHGVDIFIQMNFLGLRMNWILELTGIFLILWNAIKLLRRKVVIRINRQASSTE